MVKATGLALGLAVLLVLTGCQTAGLPQEAGQDTSDTPSDNQTDNTESEGSGPGLGSCGNSTRADIESAVVGQVEAFVAGDFDTAYSYATPDFQRAVPLDVFRQIIRSDYPGLMQATNPTSGVCDVDEERGLAMTVMTFTTPTTTRYTLRYVLEYVDDRWRIAGASEESTPEVNA
jgi:hypothetical protein